MVVFGQKLLYLGKKVVFGQNGSIRAKVDLFELKLLYSGKVVLFGKCG